MKVGKNVILTGERQVGKTTALNRFLAAYSGTVVGFRTVFDLRSRRLLLCAIPGWLSKPVPAIVWTEGVPAVDTAVFDRCVPPLLDRGAGLVVMDELGKFEGGAAAMRDAVERAFAGESRVLAVVRLDAPDWMGALKTRQDVTVVTVTSENREDIPRRLAELLR